MKKNIQATIDNVLLQMPIDQPASKTNLVIASVVQKLLLWDFVPNLIKRKLRKTFRSVLVSPNVSWYVDSSQTFNMSLDDFSSLVITNTNQDLSEHKKDGICPWRRISVITYLIQKKQLVVNDSITIMPPPLESQVSDLINRIYQAGPDNIQRYLWTNSYPDLQDLSEYLSRVFFELGLPVEQYTKGMVRAVVRSSWSFGSPFDDLDILVLAYEFNVLYSGLKNVQDFEYWKAFIPIYKKWLTTVMNSDVLFQKNEKNLEIFLGDFTKVIKEFSEIYININFDKDKKAKIIEHLQKNGMDVGPWEIAL